MLGLLLFCVAVSIVPAPTFMRAVETTAVAGWTGARDRTLDMVAKGRTRLDQLGSRADAAPPVAADAGADTVLAGDYAPADDRTRTQSGTVSFVGADIRLEVGGALNTRPDRLASSEAVAVQGVTWAEAFEIPAGIQVEIRQASGVAPSLCSGGRIGRLALVQTTRTVMILPIRSPARSGEPETLCPVLHLEKRR